MHVSADRDNPSGRWPVVGEDRDRNERLVELVLTALAARLPKVRPDARALLKLMVERARTYLADSSDNFHQMDPTNL